MTQEGPRHASVQRATAHAHSDPENSRWSSKQDQDRPCT